jgi:hypothetical protein
MLQDRLSSTYQLQQMSGPPTAAECIPPLPQALQVLANIQNSEGTYTEARAHTYLYEIITWTGVIQISQTPTPPYSSLGIAQYSPSLSSYHTSDNSSAG